MGRRAPLVRSRFLAFETRGLLVSNLLKIVGHSRAMALLLTRQTISSDEVCMPLLRLFFVMCNSAISVNPCALIRQTDTPPSPPPPPPCPSSSLFYHFRLLFVCATLQAVSLGLADIVAGEGESSVAAAVRVLCSDPTLDSNVIFGVKRAVTAATAMQEAKVFEGLWGQGAHLAAFATALRKNKC
jgi:hypothetical protein